MGKQSLYPATSIIGGRRVVTDLKTDPSSKAYNYWSAATETGKSEVMSLSVPNITGSAAKEGGRYFDRVIDSLFLQAQNEKKKEENLLRQVGINMNKITSESEFIKVINLLSKKEAELQGDLQRLLTIINGYDNKSNSKGKLQQLEKKYGSIARRLLPEMRRRTHKIALDATRSALEEIVSNKDFSSVAKEAIETMRSKVKQQFDLELKEVITNLYKETYEGEFKKRGEIGELNKRIQEITQDLSEISKYLIDAMHLNEGLSRIEKQILAAGSKEKAQKKFAERKRLYMKATSKTAHGNLEEILIPIMQTMGFEAYLRPGSTKIKMSAESKRIKTNVAKADNIMTIQTNEIIPQDINGIANMSPKDLKDASNITNNLLKNSFFDIEGLNIVFMSTKDYKISSIMKSGGFSGGQSRPIEDANSFASRAGIHFDKDFYLLAYNTMSGAIGQSRQPEVKEAIQNGVMAGVMAMLFDDSSTAGVGPGNLGATNTLHLFSLNGIYVPASYFLEAYATSLKNAKQLMNTGMVKINVSMGSINPQKIGGSGYGAVASAFSATANSAINANTFSIHFFGEFNSFIQGLSAGTLE